MSDEFRYAGDSADKSSQAWESDTMVHKHVRTSGSRRRRRKAFISPDLVEHSVSEVKITLEAQTEGNKWPSVTRTVTIDALLQASSSTALANQVVERMLCTAQDRGRTLYNEEPSSVMIIELKIGRETRGFTKVIDAVVYLSAIVVGARHYAAGIIKG